MKRIICTLIFFLIFYLSPAFAQQSFEKDVIRTSAGNLEVTFIGHGTLILTFDGKVIHIDPYSKLADYSKLPRADLIFLTHNHRDHLDPAALQHVRSDKTIIVLTKLCAEKVDGGIIMKNGDSRKVEGIPVKAVPAYNIVHKRKNGKPYHPKGDGNGYILTFGDTVVYVAGDSENTPEMKSLKNIDYAFLPVNLPYTMSPEMFIDAVQAMRPKVLYPYHYGKTDISALEALLKDVPGVEVRIREMQ